MIQDYDLTHLYRCSYLVVTVRIWSFSSGVQNVQAAAPLRRPDEEDMDDNGEENHTLETGAEYEMKVLNHSATAEGSGGSSSSAANDRSVNGQVSVNRQGENEIVYSLHTYMVWCMVEEMLLWTFKKENKFQLPTGQQRTGRNIKNVGKKYYALPFMID